MRDHTAETAFRHWFAASARKIRSFERDEMALKVEGIVDARRPVEKGSNLPDPRGREGPESLRVIRCLPVTWQCSALRGQASDKPRGRKPRGEFAPTLVSIYGEFAAAA